MLTVTADGSAGILFGWAYSLLENAEMQFHAWKKAGYLIFSTELTLDVLAPSTTIVVILILYANTRAQQDQ
jgi:hypothetical protein